MPREIYLDVETQRLAHEVPGGWANIRAFGLSVAVTWDEAHGFRTWFEPDAPRLIAELETKMKEAARAFEFEKAAQYRDRIKELRTPKPYEPVEAVGTDRLREDG